MGFNPQWLTTRTDGLFDTDRVDMGCHYNPHIEFKLNLDPDKQNFTSGDDLRLLLDIMTAPTPQTGDIYLIMLDPEGNTYFGMDWSQNIKPTASKYTLPDDLSVNDLTLLNVTIPCILPPINNNGMYSFAIAAFKTGTSEFISNLSTVGFEVE